MDHEETWEETLAWAEQIKAEWRRKALRQSRWGWPVKDGQELLDDLLTSPANVRVLRALAGYPHILFPPQIARRAKLGRTSVHVALRRLHERRLVERIAAWDSGRTFGYRLRRRHPIVKELEGLFRVEARIRARTI